MGAILRDADGVGRVLLALGFAGALWRLCGLVECAWWVPWLPFAVWFAAWFAAALVAGLLAAAHE